MCLGVWVSYLHLELAYFSCDYTRSANFCFYSKFFCLQFEQVDNRGVLWCLGCKVLRGFLVLGFYSLCRHQRCLIDSQPIKLV